MHFPFWADNPPDKKVEALRKACEKHTKITKECSKAQGHDRHLYALLCLWQREAEAALSDQDSMSRDGDSTSPNGHTEEGSVSQSPQRHQQQHHTAMPAIFADGGWDKINNTVLSTSNCGNPSLRHFGFGPASGEGFGIGYIIKDGSVSVCASSKHRQTQRYVDAMESYFIEIRKLLRQTQQGSGPEKGASRAREAEQKRPRGTGERNKSRGKLVGADVTTGKAAPEDTGEASDDDMGGCKSIAFRLLLRKHANRV